MFACPVWGTSLCSASLLALAGGTSTLLVFQGVCPVALLISPSIALESCSLNVGSLNGFSMGLVLAGGTPLPVPPLVVPPLPLPPLPCSGCLGNVVARNLCPLIGMLRCSDVDLMTGQSFGADSM